MDPQTCTKCNTLPQDILMLACSHDLCLNCAADRLQFELRKKKNASSITCEFCYERTPLDSESVAELEKIISLKPTPRSYNEPTKKSNIREQAARSMPSGRQPFSYEKTSKVSHEKPATFANTDKQFTGISSKRQCREHPQEEILYFCFDCKCECICPECVIHGSRCSDIGKHKDHDVKTIKKSQPIIKAEIEANIDKIQNNIEGLLIRKSEAQKQVRSINQQNSLSKRQIQQAFDNLRASIATQQKQILARCDQALHENIEELERVSGLIIKKIEQLKFKNATMKDVSKKEDILFLNYYSNKWKEIQEQMKNNDVHVPVKAMPSNENILSAILDANDYVMRIGAHRTSTQH